MSNLYLDCLSPWLDRYRLSVFGVWRVQNGSISDLHPTGLDMPDLHPTGPHTGPHPTGLHPPGLDMPDLHPTGLDMTGQHTPDLQPTDLHPTERVYIRQIYILL